MKKNNIKYAVGIDLGTTNSSLCYKNLNSDDIKIHELPIEQHFTNRRVVTDTKLPCVIYYKNDKLFVGLGAEEKKFSAKRDINVFYSSKSQLGQKYLYHRSKSTNIRYPFQVSGMVLKTLIDSFKSKVCNNLDTCSFVVTVPASFGGSQRSDTFKAIELSNIYPKEGMLIDEPNAAFIGYINRLGNFNVPAGSKVLVFDMGGGTTDISIIEINSITEDFLDLKNLAVSRYDLLGGDDIDAHIANQYLFKLFKDQNGINENDISFAEKEKIIISRLKKIAKTLKESLSEKISWRINKNNQSDVMKVDWDQLSSKNIISSMPDEKIKVRGKEYTLEEIKLTFEQFEKLLKPFLSTKREENNREINYNKISIFYIIENLLQIADIDESEIDYVLAIGGSPKNPLIIKKLDEYFINASIILPEDMELLVAKGAVTYAEKLATNSKIPIIPVIPDNLGIITKGDTFTKIIKSGVKVPYPKNKEYEKSDEFNINKETENVVIPICIGNKNHIYNTIKLKTEELNQSLKIGMRLDKDKMLEVKIYSGDDELEFIFDNPITVYKSSDPDLNQLSIDMYNYQKSVVENTSDIIYNHYKLIISLKNAKRYREALQYAEVLANKSNIKEIVLEQVIFYSAYLNSMLENNEKSIYYYEKLLEYNPVHSIALLNIGLKHYFNDKKNNAMDYFKKCTKQEDSNPAAYIYLGKCIKEEKLDSDESNKLIKKGISEYLKLEQLTKFDVRILIIGYKTIGLENEAKKYQSKLNKMDEKKKVYNSKELLIETIEEVEL